MNIVKLICLILVPTFFLGCVSPASHMLNNNFVSIESTRAPDHLSGIWTGSMGPALATFQLTDSGEGYFCYSHGTADVNQKTKYVDGKIHLQDGTHLEVTNLTGEKLVTNSPYGFGYETTFYPDDDLSNASIYCGKELAGS